MPPSSSTDQTTDPGDPALTTGQCASLACLLEVMAPKPGNVHRGADFDDLTFRDFVASSVAIAPAMQSATQRPAGQTVLDAIRATRALVGTNTNLGTVLLLAPLAAVPREAEIRGGVAEVLASLGPEDAVSVYRAIRLAQPGGLGRVEMADVHQSPPSDLLAAMRAAASRDLVARQYTNGFAEVFTAVVPWLADSAGHDWSLNDRIVVTHLRLMSQFPDSLIARKCGRRVAQQASVRAASVLEAGRPGQPAYCQALADFDFWLRSDHHRRNPGTTADLIAAGLFVALRDSMVRVRSS